MRDPDKYQQYSYVFDGVHAQGGLVGYDHLAWSKSYYIRQDPRNAETHPYPGWDVNINTIRGKVDFFSILQNNNLGLQDYYDFLNLGVKVTATASTDYPAPVVGEEITYAYTGTGEKFSPDTWYDAVRRGRTFVTNGPMLALTVGDAMPGDEVRVGKDAKLQIHARGLGAGIDRRAEGARDRRGRAGDPRGGIARPAAGQTGGRFRSDRRREPVDRGAHDGFQRRGGAYHAGVRHRGQQEAFIDHANVQQNVAKQLKVLDLIETKRLDNPQIYGELGTRHWSARCGRTWRMRAPRYLSLAAAPDRPAITGIANIALQGEQSGGGAQLLRARPGL